MVSCIRSLLKLGNLGFQVLQVLFLPFSERALSSSVLGFTFLLCVSASPCK